MLVLLRGEDFVVTDQTMDLSSGNAQEKKKVEGKGLVDLVFSWSFKDILNKNLYKEKVKPIPEVFASAAHYMNSFKYPLEEETRAEFCSGLESVGRAPACELVSIQPIKTAHKLRVEEADKPPKEFKYNILIKRLMDFKNPGGHYDPEPCDVLALTSRRPRDIGDLIRPGKRTTFAFVLYKRNEDDPQIPIQTLEDLLGSELLSKKNDRLFATYLMNLTTGLRIWRALRPDPKRENLGLIRKVLQYDSSDDSECPICVPGENAIVKEATVLDLIASYRLDESQTNAVLSSVFMAKCSHQKNNVKLIWGPPGTGKTKTVASMLFVLLKLKCRTVTCAPTNIAVLQVAERLVRLFLGSLQYDTYGLGDIVLFGNGTRMKIDDHKDLLDVFLKYRVDILYECLSPFGWKYKLESMMRFLKCPRQQYNTYLGRVKTNNNDKDKRKETSNKATNNVLTLKGSEWRSERQLKEMNDQSLTKNRQKAKIKAQSRCLNGGKAEIGTKREDYMTFEEFVMKTFSSEAHKLATCAKNLYTHLPTSALPLDIAKQMVALVDVLQTLENARARSPQFSELMTRRKGILSTVESLLKQFPKPKIKGKMRDYCMANAVLLFCTASGSIKVNTGADLVIVDEAAQLKECESTIPIQIPRLRNAVLIGDDRQLPAMVQSKILEKLSFGRSLFQRLVRLGKRKHLLNIQYRMHPSISSFPNKKFYDNSIVDAPNVKETSYTRSYLKGDMYGSFTFINVSGGNENFSKGHSPRNMEEAAVIQCIIGKLFKYHCETKQAITVGVISPYKGQVGLIQEKLERKYAKQKGNGHGGGFAVNVRSVDGFQGGEEDIIIISTVRCNRNGSVGFLSNHQRTNVALTRARYCLWIVGNGSTLANSGTVWKDLVADAKTRGCFFDADHDTQLKQLQTAARGETNRLVSILDVISLELAKARWKVFFSDDFKMSLAKISSNETHKQVKEMLNKIANGWRQSGLENGQILADHGACSNLLERYKLDEQLYLAWTTDIQKEESKYTQVIKIWDIVPASEIPRLANNLDIMFGGYTVDTMNRCKYKSYEKHLIVPMSWPISSGFSVLLHNDPAECLSDQLAAMNLRDDKSDSSSTISTQKKVKSELKRKGGISTGSTRSVVTKYMVKKK